MGLLGRVLQAPEHSPTIEILELILGFECPAHLAHHLARVLLAEFGELRTIVSQDSDTLTALGVPPQAADILLLVSQIIEHLSHSEDYIVERQKIDTRPRAITYFNTVCAGRKEDWVGLLFLDRKLGALKSRIFTATEFTFDDKAPARMVEMALEENACGLLIAMGRFQKDPSPTVPEINSIRRFDEIGQSLGLQIHEFLIFDDAQVTSYYEIVDPVIEHDNLTEGDIRDLIEALKLYAE